MIKIKNQQVVKRVAKQTYQANKKRNLLTILAVILTTFLIISVLGIGIGYWQMITERQIKMSGMDYDIELTEPTAEQVQTAWRMEQVKYAGVAVKCAIVETANDRNISKIQLFWVDDTCWKKQCLPAFDKVTGEYPQTENEVMLSAGALKAMGIENPRLGMPIKVTYDPLTDELSTEGSRNYTFILSGYYTDFSGDQRGYISPSFFQITGAKQTDFTQGMLKITLKNSIYSNETISNLQNEFKLVNKQMLIADETSISSFIKAVLVLTGLLVMIFISGYLFIYNTLYISVSKDIRYYGQLKTLGMTSIQLKKVIYHQAFWNSIIGIPLGLLAGYLVSIKLIPMVLKIQNPTIAGITSFSYYPLLFVIAAAFAALTILISTKKPAQIAGNCSPIEAILYTRGRTKTKKSENGLKSMVWRNIFRDKIKAAIVLGSFIISIVIFFTVHVVIRENDSRSVLNQVYSYDLRMLNETVLNENKPVITEDIVNEVEQISGVKDARMLYSALIDVPYQEDVFGNFYKKLYQSRYSPGDYDADISSYKSGGEIKDFFKAKIIGIDEQELQRLIEDAGIKVDTDKFMKGEAALTSTWLSMSPDDAKGKTVSFTLEDDTKERRLEIAGIVDDPSYYASGYTPAIIISDKLFKQIVANPVIELVYVDYETNFDKEAEKQVKVFAGGTRDISFVTKIDRYQEMLSNEKQIRVLGNGVGIMIALLSVLNYINMMAAQVQNRQKEFAVLESIGMTKKQIIGILIKEGAAYAMISIIAAVVLAIPVSYIVFQSMNIYGVAFSIPVLSNLILFAGILIVCILVPPGIYYISGKGSVIERLRKSDES